jgi:hypothetical protein
MGLKPRARIRAMASIGSEPCIMLTGPADVSRKALKKAGMEVGDIDLYELNEAFASVVLRMMQALDIPHEKMNVNGGAIAMGHPLGATGGIHVVHVLMGFGFLAVAIHQMRSPARRSIPAIEACGIYWHMVDFLWVIIFALLYVMR